MEVLEWNRPAVVFYHERVDKPEREPFAVIKARKILMKNVQEGGFEGEIIDFFSLMGDVDYVSTPEGRRDYYVLCWFDDSEDDFRKSFRRLNGVVFPSGLSYTVSNGKRTYNAQFKAKRGKLA